MILIPPEIPGESSAPGGVEQRPPATAMLTLLAGALLIAVGVLFLLENLDVLHWRHAWRVMRDILVPMLVIAIGVALLLRSRKDRKPAEPGVPLEQSPLPTGQWYRARDGRRILGICSGIAKAMNVDVTLVRFAWVIFTLFSGGVGVIGYILLAIVLPEEPITNGNA
jgi:phage shock protein PspC (stress-responsive transcriptional regulator)